MSLEEIPHFYAFFFFFFFYSAKRNMENNNERHEWGWSSLYRSTIQAHSASLTQHVHNHFSCCFSMFSQWKPEIQRLSHSPFSLRPVVPTSGFKFSSYQLLSSVTSSFFAVATISFQALTLFFFLFHCRDFLTGLSRSSPVICPRVIFLKQMSNQGALLLPLLQSFCIVLRKKNLNSLVRRTKLFTI